jgi:hypothetical protein
MSKRRRTETKQKPAGDVGRNRSVRDDETLARNFFLASLAGIAVGAVAGWFYYGSQGATVGAVFGAVLGVGVLFAYLYLRVES